MENKDKYVILTGSKNNAGDFLIKYRAKQLFSALRPDREIIDYDAWKPLTEKQLEVINSAKALILMGGPALQFHMYPKIYALTNQLDKIKVPIIMMGVGYKDQIGTWDRTQKYLLSPQTTELINRVRESGFISGVRDYHTLNVLNNKGYDNFLMTGCPALYDLNFLDKPFDKKKEINTIAFSLGVSYLESASMNKLMKEVIKSTRELFLGKKFAVLFHHTINLNNAKQKEMIDWLTKENISYKDIAGSEEQLIAEYSAADLHIGYRVHAHIFMSSISKPTVLLNEDGRGKALFHVINGLIIDSYKEIQFSTLDRVKIKLNLFKDFYMPYTELPRDLCENLTYEMKHAYPRLGMSRKCIDDNFDRMKEFIAQLP